MSLYERRPGSECDHDERVMSETILLVHRFMFSTVKGLRL